MWVHAPERTRRGEDLLISAQVSGYRQPLWFKFPIAYEAQISGEIDPFVIALLLLAMQKGEDLHVEGSLSRQLHEGLLEYQKVIHSWFPDRFKCIAILPHALRADARSETRNEGVAFSGGVDSFYSFVSLRPQLSHGLFMAGFDMPLQLVDSIGELTRSYQPMWASEGKQLIVGSTNIRRFVDTVDWTNAHGPALAASAHFFAGAWRKFYVPSSYTQSGHPKWGTHPELDPLFSSEKLEFAHHGAKLNRLQKLQVIAQVPLADERLRVCWIQDLGLHNCGVCEKCVRTQIALELLGVRERFTTFDPALFNRALIRNLSMRTHQARIFGFELLAESVRRRRWDVAGDLTWAFVRRSVRRWTQRVRKRTPRASQDRPGEESLPSAK